MCFYLRNWQVTFLLYTLGVFISEYTAKAFTEPRDYRVVFLIQSPEVPKGTFRDCKQSPRSRASPDFGSSPIQKTPFTSVKGEFSAVPPYFIYAVTHIYLTFYNGNYSGITYFNRSIIRFRSYLPSSFFRNCLSAGSSSSFAQSPAKLP